MSNTEREQTINEIMEEMRQELYGVVDKYVGRLRQEALVSLRQDPKLSWHITSLPWSDVDKVTGPRTVNALRRCHYNTVGDIVNVFTEISKVGGCLPYIRNYGRRSHEITYEVFKRIGIELPEVEISKHRISYD